MKSWGVSVAVVALLVAASVTVYLYFRGGNAVPDDPPAASADKYLDLKIEQVMFRRETATGRVYRKFYGSEEEPNPISFKSRIYLDARQFGESITRDEYLKGHPVIMQNELKSD